MISSKHKKHHNKYSPSSKKIVKGGVFIVLLAIAVFSLLTLKEKLFFPIKTVKVYGIQHVNKHSVQHVVQPLINQGFFAVNVALIKEKLLQLSWIADVSVNRVWPDRISITLAEKNPLAHWNDKSLLSANGELFIPDEQSDDVAGLPEFIGPEGEQIAMLKLYTEINAVLEPLHSKIARLELNYSEVCNVTLDNGIKLNVKQKDILTHVSHFVKVYPKIIGERAAEVEYVDMRYPNGFAIRWKSLT